MGQELWHIRAGSFSAVLVLLMVIQCTTAGKIPASSKQLKHTMTKQQAKEIAVKAISNLKPGTEFVVLDDKTVEKDFGWVFFYSPTKYLETKDPKYLTPGNSPIIVDRADGATHFLPTSVPPPRAIEIYEQHWHETHK